MHKRERGKVRKRESEIGRQGERERRGRKEESQKGEWRKERGEMEKVTKVEREEG